MRDRLVAETDSTQQKQQTDIHAPAGFETAIPTRELPQTYALDYATTGIGERRN